MSKEEIKKAGEVMIAYASGKKVEYTCRSDEGAWRDATCPTFNWSLYNFRIKQETKHRPFKDGEECWDEMKKHEPFGWICEHNNPNFKLYVLSVDNNGIMVSDYDDGAIYQNFETLFNLTSFVDGSPFGIIKQ